MIRLDRVSCWIFIISFILLIPSCQVFKYADEIISLLFLLIAGIDCILNGNWRKYKILWIIVSIFSAYAVYSLLFLHFNTPHYILKDFIIEIKPYLPFIVMLTVSPRFTLKDKEILRIISVINIVISFVVLVSRYTSLKDALVTPIFLHVMFAGATIFVSTMVYIFSSINSDGSIGIKKLSLTVLFLISGLFCTRSKYYGEFVVSVFFLFFYRPGILKNFSLKHAILLLTLIVTFIAVGWSKFEYYFITGNSDSFDPNVMESYARPVLYITSGLVLMDYFPFGSGFASFASFPSSENYSQLYYEYNLDKIWGLSPSMPNFICDAFYPSLAQFGIVGAILFVYFWIYIYKYLKTLIRNDRILNKYVFCIGVLLMCFLLIECIASTLITQNLGMMAMMLLGIICSEGKQVEDDNIENEKINGNGKI